MIVRTSGYSKAFSLIELLVVLSLISLLMCILLPVLSTSRAQSKKIACASNLRQLLLANINYARENHDYYVHAATDIFSDNKYRWYGVRDNTSEPFDLSKGPLASQLGQINVKCPAQVNYTNLKPSEPEYDQGSGGYGYNMIYIGSTIWRDGYEDESCKQTSKTTSVKQPAKTLIFADTAMIKSDNYIEYSFAEPRYFVVNDEPDADSGWEPTPSIHFRHREFANIGWADGHVDSEKMGKYDSVNNNRVRPSGKNLGWFEPMDNSMFDLN
jgi:prepilin-type N-terminal cleavage/methylation domain-containing protein/prepilin-type processing-associated H-X9-DG protein